MLPPRKAKVIKMRFGLEDGDEHTLEEVGQSFAVPANASTGSKPRL
jgi:RNA polymerase primary sigma factor